MIVIDDFVSDRAILQRVAADATFFASNGTYMWWDGWWRGSANTLKRELIEYIWREHCPCGAVTAAGFEYWTGRYAGDDQHPSTLDLHVDKDEYLWDTQDKVVSPLVGSVFYPVEMDIDGGYLEIFSRGENMEPERLEAKFNRLVIFDAGAHQHRVTQVNRGTRSALAINLWAEAPSGLAHGAIVPE